MASEPSYSNETLKSYDEVLQIFESEIATIWRLINDAFNEISTDLPDLEISDGEVTVPAKITELSIQLKTFSDEMLEVKKVSVGVGGLIDKKNNLFKSCSLTIWFKDDKISVLWRVHSAGPDLVLMRNWGKGLYDRVNTYLEKIGNVPGSGIAIHKDGKVNLAPIKEEKPIQDKIIQQQIINAKKIQGSNISQNGNVVVDQKEKTQLLERLSWWSAIVAAIIAVLIYVGIKIIS